jgi:ubiquinone/menaquinone biosynthesis C-methylase UbiE
VSFYAEKIVPHLVHLAMRQSILTPYRQRVISAAAGRVLEIGVGSGLNFPYYDTARVERVIGLDPSTKLLSMAGQVMKHSSLRLELLKGSAEEIPLEDQSVEIVVTSWTLCSISDVRRALSEMRRVLRSDGRLLFVEHGLSPDANVRRWQDRLTPLWKRLSGGCHLNRPIQQLVEDSGFRIEQLNTGYMKGPSPMTFMYEGSARPLRPA